MGLSNATDAAVKRTFGSQPHSRVTSVTAATGRVSKENTQMRMLRHTDARDRQQMRGRNIRASASSRSRHSARFRLASVGTVVGTEACNDISRAQ